MGNIADSRDAVNALKAEAGRPVPGHSYALEVLERARLNLREHLEVMGRELARADSHRLQEVFERQRACTLPRLDSLEAALEKLRGGKPMTREVLSNGSTGAEETLDTLLKVMNTARMDGGCHSRDSEVLAMLHDRLQGLV